MSSFDAANSQRQTGAIIAYFVFPFVAGGLTAIIAYSAVQMVGIDKYVGSYGSVGVAGGAAAIVTSYTNIFKVFGNY